MFKVNDIVKYGGNGVYKITDIRQEAFQGNEKTKYYVLTHVKNDSLTVYCPVENSKIPLHKLLSVEEIYQLIKKLPKTEGEWIENDRERKEAFTKIIRGDNRQELFMLIKTLYHKQREMTKSHKKLHVADERMMKEAEKILYEEIAHVLQIQYDEVLPFITREINKAK